MTIAQDLKKSAIDSALIELYIVDLNPIGVSEVFYLTPNTRASAAISFVGQEYDPFPITSSGWEISVDGKQPQPTLVVSNVTQFLNSYIAQYEDLVGARVTRILTLEKYLDDGATPGNQTISVDACTIFQMAGQTRTAIEFKLAALIDRPGRKFPQGQVLRAEFPGAGQIRRN